MAGTRIEGGLDIFNVLSASDVLAFVTRYGTDWLKPSEVLGARLFRFAAQFDF